MAKRKLGKTLLVLVSVLVLVLPAAQAAARGALFKASAHGHTMLLFGTIHVGKPEWYPLDARVTQAVADGSKLALEIDPLADPVAMARAVQQYGLAGPDEKAAPALAPRLHRALRGYGIEPATVERLKPWLIATTLTLGEYTAQGTRPDLSVDLQLAQLARARGVPIVALESLEAQLQLFNRLTPAQQWDMLGETVDAIENGRQSADVREVIDAWGNADRRALDAIAAKAEADRTISGVFLQQVLLVERNGPMADKLAGMLKQEDKVVAAVGMMHLIGRSGIPAQLRARGIAVERIY